MHAHFLPVTAGVLERVLPFMAGLYERDTSYDSARGRATAEWLLDNPDSGGMWLIQAGGVDAGYLVLTVCVSLEFGGRFALLDELYLDAPWRGRGIAAQAIEFALAWARSRQMSALRLETWTENAHAIHVYRKCGFEVDPRHLMTKWLPR